MKLLNQINRLNITAALILLSFSGLLIYYLIRMEVTEEISEQLWVKAVWTHEMLEEGRPISDPLVKIDSVSKAGQLYFTDTLIYVEGEEEYEPYRKLIDYYETKGQIFRLQIISSRLEWEDLLWTIFVSILIAFLSLLGLGVWINYRINKKVWKPFFENLKRLRKYSMLEDEQSGLYLESSSVLEFEELNQALMEMTKHLKKEYRLLKNFTENASHEIQTPLTIITTKLDHLDQHSWPEGSLKRLGEIRDAVNRLSRLTKDLLLLTKIDNNQFQTSDKVNLEEIVQSQWDLMQPMFIEKGIECELQIEEKPIPLVLHTYLFRQVVSNLFTNAYRYTPEKGFFMVRVNREEMVCINSGSLMDIEPSLIFNRFQKGGGSESLGLGLSLAKSICIMHKFDLSYSYSDNKHHFKISF